MSPAELVRRLLPLLRVVVDVADDHAREQLRDLEALTAEGVEIPTDAAEAA